MPCSHHRHQPSPHCGSCIDGHTLVAGAFAAPAFSHGSFAPSHAHRPSSVCNPPWPYHAGFDISTHHGPEVRIQTRAQARPTHDGGYVYMSHTTITSDTPHAGYAHGSYAPLPSSVFSHPPRRPGSVVASHASRQSQSRAAGPLALIPPSRTHGQDDRPCTVIFGPPASQARVSQAPSRYYPPRAGRGRVSHGFVVGEVDGPRAPSTVAPESSVSNWAQNVDKATRRERDRSSHVSRQSGSRHQ